MRKSFLLFIIAIFSFISVQSQDLLITSTNDSIACQIENVLNNHIFYSTVEEINFEYYKLHVNYIKDTLIGYYSQDITDTLILMSLHKNKILTKDGETIYCEIKKKDMNHLFYSETIGGKEIFKGISLSSVENFGPYRAQNGFFYQNQKINYSKPMDTTFQKVQLLITSGIASRIGEIPDNLSSSDKAYIENLMSGYYFGGNLSFYWNQSVGIGIKYSGFRSNASGTISFVDVDNNPVTLPMSSDLEMNFVGVLLNLRLANLEKKYQLNSSISIGQLTYNETGKIENMNTKATAKTVAIGVETTGIYSFNKHIGLALNINILGGSFTSMDYKIGDYSETITFDEDSPENGGRVEFGLGLIFSL